MTPSLELRDLCKSYHGKSALDGVSLAVAPGTVFGLLGPNGAGKTTTLRIIMNIVAPDTGEVLFFGRRRRASRPLRIGYLPEERGLYKKMGVREQLVFLGELHGLPRREAMRAADFWLERLELGPRARSRVEELSKGMQQKLQLAGVLLHDPEVLILDEPFTGLDPINQNLFRGLLAGYRNRHRTILLSTHVMEHAETLCDSICLLSRGRVVLSGELAALKRRFGRNAYRLVAQGDLSRIHQLASVERCVESDGAIDLLLRPGVAGSAVLRELVEFLQVSEFRAREATLEDIFVEAVHRAA